MGVRSIAARCFRRADGLVTRNIGGTTVVVPIRSDVADLNGIFTLNEVGTRVWDLLDGQTAFERIVETVTDEHDVSAQEAARDVGEFLGLLEERRLIVPGG